MKKGRLSTIILILVFLAGLSLLLYPTVSDYWNSLHQSWAIADYATAVAEADGNTYSQLWEDAQAYNRSLLEKEDRYTLTAEEQQEYEALLCISDNGVIGYVEIPRLECALPIFHGTDESVLQLGVGHLEGTSLPVGGDSTHTVISGHRGLPSAKLFTDLDQMETGDIFYLRVLDQTLAYMVDQITVVQPYEIDALQIQEGEDQCTLVTCTPYGINTQRLLVRGHRIETTEDTPDNYAAAATGPIEPIVILPVAVALLLLVLLIVLLVRTRRRKT